MPKGENKILAAQFKRAIREGRLCKQCGWMIPITQWKKGYRICASCYSANKGVNVRYGAQPYKDEPEDMTGEM